MMRQMALGTERSRSRPPCDRGDRQHNTERVCEQRGGSPTRDRPFCWRSSGL